MKRTVAAWAVALFASQVAAGAPVKDVICRGVVLPGFSEQVGEDRYKIPLTYADALKYFKNTLKGSQEKPIVNQPGIRARHFTNPGSGEWEGLNVYERDGQVRVFVLARPKKEEKKKTGK